jgi:acyl-CoA synthetase (AMP-forming)/AMP-acid ligase II
MMSGYHKRVGATREAEWFDATGKRFIRAGEVGRFDTEGVLTLLDRRKDVIISGGLNIYPSDLEGVLCEQPAVADVAVVGMRSRRWGETPVAFVVGCAGQEVTDDAARLQRANARLGKTQRLHSLRSIDLPRSPIGKVLKRDLRELHGPV